jgi:hypothetical protein
MNAVHTGKKVRNTLIVCSRKVPESIPSGVTGFFSDVSPSDRTMALGSTQPPVKMSTRNIPGGKGGRCVRLTTSPTLRAECHGIWEHKPPGTLWATPGLLRDYSSLIMCVYNVILWRVSRTVVGIANATSPLL